MADPPTLTTQQRWVAAADTSSNYVRTSAAASQMTDAQTGDPLTIREQFYLATPVGRTIPPVPGTVVVVAPTVTFSSFSWAGTRGGLTSAPTWIWTLSSGTAAPTSLTVTVYADASSTPTTVLVTPTVSATTTTYAVSLATAPNNYYKISVTATNSAGYSTFSDTEQNLFDPKGLSAKLVTWFKGDAGLSTSTWTNYGTYASNATLTGVTLTTQNGLSAANFTTTSSWGDYSTSFVNTPSFSNESRSVFFVVATATQPTSSQTFLPLTEPTSVGGFKWGIYVEGRASNQIYPFHLDSSVALMCNLVNPYTLNTTVANTYALVWDGASSTQNSQNFVNINGTTLDSQIFADYGYYDTGSAYRTGLNGGGSQSAATLIPRATCTISKYCELMVYGGPVSAADSATIIAYLRAKWGTP